MRCARVLAARPEVRIAQGARNAFLEPRPYLIGDDGGPGLKAPWRLRQRLGGSRERRGSAGGHRASKSKASAKQGTTIEKSVAGDGFDRYLVVSRTTTMLAHAFLPVGRWDSCLRCHVVRRETLRSFRISVNRERLTEQAG